MPLSPPLTLRTLAAGLALALPLAVSGCGESPNDPDSAIQTDPDASDTPIEVNISGDTVTPEAQELSVGAGSELTLEVTSDRAAEIHVHSNPEQEFQVEAGQSSLKVTLDDPGQVDIEEHDSDTLLVRVLVK